MTPLTYKGWLPGLFLLLSCSFCMAQANLPDALDTLKRDRLITDRERELVLERFATFEKMKQARSKETGNEKETETTLPDYTRKDELLGLLVQAKQFSTAGVSRGFGFTAAPIAVRKMSPTAVRVELDIFIRDLFRAGLVSDYTHQELLRRNRRNQFDWKLEAADFARTVANEEYFLRPEKLKRFVDPLLAAKVISETHYQELMEKSAQGQLHRYAEITGYLDFFTSIDISGIGTRSSPKARVATGGLSRDSHSFLRAVYQKTSMVFPGLRYDSIQFGIQKDPDESAPDFEAYDLVTTIWQKGKKYSGSGFYSTISKGERDAGFPIPENYHAVFNKMLVEQSSRYRLLAVAMDRERFGMIALTKAQFEQFNWTYDGQLSSYVNVIHEDYTGKLTQENISAAIRVYDSLGLFSHLSAAEKDSGIEKAGVAQINNYTDLLKCFKNLVFDIDVKYGVNDGQYGELTRQIALVSKGQFSPEKILDDYSYEYKHFTYGFTFHNKPYTVALYQEGKYLDEGFWDLIKKALKENSPSGRFHEIYPTDGITEIYLTDEQFAVLESKGLLDVKDRD